MVNQIRLIMKKIALILCGLVLSLGMMAQVKDINMDFMRARYAVDTLVQNDQYLDGRVDTLRTEVDINTTQLEDSLNWWMYYDTIPLVDGGYFVAKSGSDAGDGSFTDPWATWNLFMFKLPDKVIASARESTGLSAVPFI